MTIRRRRFDLPPRIVNDTELAAYIGHSLTWLKENRERLEAMGLPRPLPVLGGYDRHAVDEWLDRLGGRVDLVRDGADALTRAAGRG